MGLGISSWSFILCAPLIFVIIQDSGARKLQLKEGSYDLQHLAPKGHVINYIMRVEGADDVEINKNPVLKDDDDNQDLDNKKLKGKYVKQDDHDDDEDSDDEESDDEDSDDEDEDDEDEDDHKELKGKYVKKVDEHIKILGKDVHAHMDPELDVFFRPGDLTVGKTMPIYFSKRDSSTSPKFLPIEAADQVSIGHLKVYFSI